MNRRTIPLALAGAALLPVFAPGLAQAQGNSPSANVPPENLAAAPPERLARMLFEAGSFSHATARIGGEKATNPEVKRFAQFEVQEQEGVAQAMKLAGHDFPMASLGNERGKMIEALNAASGAEFERMFLEVQERGHQELLSLTSAIMEGRGPVPDKIMATLSNNSIKEHLILIGTLRGQTVQTTQGGGNPPSAVPPPAR